MNWMQLARRDSARRIPARPRQSYISRVVLFIVRLCQTYISLEWQAHLVVALAILAMLYVQLAQPLYWAGGDALSYYRTARFLLHKPEGMYNAEHALGMALFHILTGVAWLDTFKIFIALYAAMSVAIPVFIYAILRRFSPTWALVAGLIAIFGAVPYINSRDAISDHLFSFVHFGVLALVAAFLVKPDSKTRPYAICFAMFALSLVRPVAALYYWIFFVCAILLVRRHLKHVFLATAVYVCLMGGWALAERYYGASIFPDVYAPETREQRLFGEVYFSGGQYHFVPELPPVLVIKPGDGSASAQMYEGLRWLVQNYPDQWKKPTAERPYLLFGRFAGQPEQLVQAVVSKPNFAYFDFLRHALQAKYGTPGSEALMYRIAAEHGNTGAQGVVRYFAHSPTKLLVGGTPPGFGRRVIGVFYFLPERRLLHRFYSLTWGLADLDQRLLDDFHVTQTPEKEDQLFTGAVERGLDLLNPKNGPASMEFFNALHFFIRAYPGYWEHTNPWLSRHRGDPEGFFRAIFDNNNKPYSMEMYGAFYLAALNKYYGIGPTDRLLARVGLETLKTYPYSAAIVWDNALYLTLLRTISDIKWRSQGPEKFWLGIRPYSQDTVYTVRKADFTGLTPGLKKELKEVIHGTPYVNAIGIAYSVMHLVAPLFFVASFVLFPFSLLGPAWRVAVFLAVAYVYNVAVVAFFGHFSEPRFEDVFILLPVMLACLGAQSALSTFQRRTKLNEG